MPSQITPNVTTIKGTVDTADLELRATVEEILEVNERLLKQLSLVTGLELEKGDI